MTRLPIEEEMSDAIEAMARVIATRTMCRAIYTRSELMCRDGEPCTCRKAAQEISALLKAKETT